MPKSANPLVSQQLFEAIKAAVEAGWSINRIAHEAGIKQASLQFWYSGARSSLALETVNAVCRFFGMRLNQATIPDPGDEVRKPTRKPKAKASRKRKS